MRALAPWRPLRQLSSLHDDIDRVFTEFFGPAERGWGGLDAGFAPAIESYLKDGNLVVRAEMPGIDPKDVELTVENDRLYIRGERKSGEEHEDREYLYREVSRGRFERTIGLPRGIDPESVSATYRDGVLEVTMTAPRALVAKKVPITVH